MIIEPGTSLTVGGKDDALEQRLDDELTAFNAEATGADQRHAGWGSRLMRAAEEESVRRGCTEMIVSSFTFQAPDFYKGLGFRETGRTEGIPGGHQDVHLHKVIGS